MSKLTFEERADETLERADEFIDELEDRYDVDPDDTDDEDLWFCSAYQVFWASTMRLMAYGWTAENLKTDIESIAESHAEIMRDIEKIEVAQRTADLMLKLGVVRGGKQ